MATGMAGSCSKSSSQLSAEQLRRIEENRRRARERLARKTHAEQPPKSNNTAHVLSTAIPFPHAPVHGVIHGVIHGSCNHATVNSRPQSHDECSSAAKVTTGSATSVKKPDTAIKKVVELVRPAIKANLRLTSKQRFEIVMPYDRQAIEVFKKTPTNAYGELTNSQTINY